MKLEGGKWVPWEWPPECQEFVDKKQYIQALNCTIQSALKKKVDDWAAGAVSGVTGEVGKVVQQVIEALKESLSLPKTAEETKGYATRIIVAIVALVLIFFALRFFMITDPVTLVTNTPAWIGKTVTNPEKRAFWGKAAKRSFKYSPGGLVLRGERKVGKMVVKRVQASPVVKQITLKGKQVTSNRLLHRSNV